MARTYTKKTAAALKAGASKRAPAKPNKFFPREVTPEYKAWAREDAIDHCVGLGMHPSWFFPEDDDKAIPDEGAWICVTDVPHTGLSFEVPPLSMWRATRHEGELLAKGLPFPSQQAVIHTPGGNLHLWPTEYSIIDNINLFVGQEPDCVMHKLGGEPVLAEDPLFYLMLRGIPRQDAALMLLGDVTSQDFVYFTWAPFYQEFFEGVGVPLGVHIARHHREASHE
jgi:hypothetical protein